MIECSLCGMQFNEKYNTLLGVVKRTHERFHIRCAFQSRHKVEGVVEWVKT
jgi:hypothetical protein